MSPELELQLKERLREFGVSRYRRNSMFLLIKDFLMAPQVTKLTEESNRLHTVEYPNDQHGEILSVSLYAEKEERAGFWYNLGKVVKPNFEIVRVWLNDQVFICEYYKHHYFSICDTMKEDYDKHIRPATVTDFIIMERCK